MSLGMSLEIYIGQKIKCINSRFKDNPNSPFKISEINIPKLGEKYTVREIVNFSGNTGIRLEEIKNKQYWFKKIGKWEEPFFGAYHFKILN